MSCGIKKVSADATVPDVWYVSTTPTVWDPVFANRTTYATVYAAQTDAKSIRDGVAGYPPVQTSDHVVIEDTAAGTEYRVRSAVDG